MCACVAVFLQFVWSSTEGEIVHLEEKLVLSCSVAEQRAIRKLVHKSLESDLGISFAVPKGKMRHIHASILRLLCIIVCPFHQQKKVGVYFHYFR